MASSGWSGPSSSSCSCLGTLDSDNRPQQFRDIVLVHSPENCWVDRTGQAGMQPRGPWARLTHTPRLVLSGENRTDRGRSLRRHPEKEEVTVRQRTDSGMDGCQP